VVSPKFPQEIWSRYIGGTVTEADFDNTKNPSARAALRLKLDEMLMLQRLPEEQEKIKAEQERSKAEFEGLRADTTRKMEEMTRETTNLANTLYEFVTRDVLEISKFDLCYMWLSSTTIQLVGSPIGRKTDLFLWLSSSRSRLEWT